MERNQEERIITIYLILSIKNSDSTVEHEFALNWFTPS